MCDHVVRMAVTCVKRHTAVTICEDYFLEVLNFRTSFLSTGSLYFMEMELNKSVYLSYSQLFAT